MLSKLCVRGTHKNTCEDSVFVKETESFIWGCVCDGCSTGINSHFASQLFCYTVADGDSNCTSENSLLYYTIKIKQVKALFSFSDMQLLSTCILFHYNKNTRLLKVRPVGDGVYYVNGTEYIVDHNNIPDYIAYHFTESFIETLRRYPEYEYENVDSFQICSDGIKSFSISQFESSDKSPELLLNVPVSENYLQRAFNILTKNKWTILDDLSIISYVNSRKQQS